jgi:hypothetical protein
MAGAVSIKKEGILYLIFITNVLVVNQVGLCPFMFLCVKVVEIIFM